MSVNQNRIELILDLRNQLRSGLTQARGQIDSEIGRMRSRLNEFGAGTSRHLQNLRNEIPALDSGLRVLSNPIALLATGAGAIATGFIKATNAAADFNHEFRDLANLNLDKTQNEINGLRNMVLDSAWRKGFDSKRTSNAYNEIQSTVGLYGEAARPIIEKQGEFATLMKTSMDQYVAGTAKAMANWRFGVDKLDAFNKSNYAAMQVGVVSFDELAKVQSVYAGASASINQSFDTANKLFSIFTVRTKSVDEAATLTKSLFNDLTKKSTIDAFKKVGINMFDSNKQLKQADVIMMELNSKFLQMKNDKSIVALKNQFVGSEGLIAMIQAATDRSGELNNILNEFADTKFNADNALSQAQNDILYRQEQLTNRVDNLMIRLGQVMLPIKEKIVGVAEKLISNVDFYGLKDEKERQETIASKAKSSIYETYSSYLTDIDNLTENELTTRLKTLMDLSNKAMGEFQTKTKEYANDNFWNYNPINYLSGRDAKLEEKDQKTAYDRIWAKGKSDGLRALAVEMEQKWYNKGTIADANKPSGKDTNLLDGSKTAGDSIDKVVGSSKQVRNIVVNIDSFNKGGINTQNTSLQKMDAKDIETWFVDTCLRAVRNLELSY